MEGKYTSFLKKGKEVEKKFANLFKDTSPATEDQDMNEHWDVQINYKIDVKGLKKIRRQDQDVNENIHWVELRNVHGKLGWLYAEKTDFFAFELKNYWIIVEKQKLQDFIALKVEKIYTQTPSMYKLYARQNRNDLLTLVNSFDLIYICETLVSK